MSEPAIGASSRISRAWPFAVLLFMLVGAHTLLETARDSLFLRTQPVSRLPWVYLAVAVAVLVVTPAQVWVLRRKTGRLVLAATLLVATALTVAFWAATMNSLVVNAFYVWTALFSSLVFAQFWLGPAEAFNTGEAKRLFAFIGAGGLVGAVAGAATAKLVLMAARPRSLLLASAALTLGGAIVASVWRPPSRLSPAAGDIVVLRAVPQEALHDPYLRLLTLLALVPALAATLVDYVFKAAVAAHIAPHNIPEVVANAYLAQTLLGLIVEVLAVRFLLGYEGVTRSLLLLPVVLLATATGFAVASTVALAVCLKVLDGGLRPSLYRVSTELLYVPVPPARRRLLKPSIDTVGQRGGQSAASLVLLLVQNLASAPALAAVAIAGAAVVWLQVIRALRSRYVQLFRAQLASGRAETTRLPKLDLEVAQTLVAALGSHEVREVLTAMDLLARYGRLRLVPGLILYHPDAVVVRAALEHFEGSERDDVDALGSFLLKHPDESVRAAGIRRWVAAKRSVDELQKMAEDPSPVVRATALVAFSGTPAGAEVMPQLQAIARGASNEERRALAHAIADSPRPDLSPVLEALFACPDLETRREVIRSTQRLVPVGAARFVPNLGAMLVDPRLRSVARDALVAIGEPALEWLAEQLRSDATPFHLAREIPATVARFPHLRAAPILMETIASPEGGLVRFRALRALNQIHRERPDVSFQRSVLEAALRIELSKVFKSRALRLAAARCRDAHGEWPAGMLLLEILEGKETLAIERVFRVLQLLFPKERVERVYLGWRSRRPELRVAAEELLFELLPAPWREAVLAVLDSEALGAGEVRPPWSLLDLERPELFMEELLGHSSELIRILAASLAAELGWTETIPRLRNASETMEPEGRELVSNAISRLENTETRPHG
jgi:ATP:ADP antiporter, AAA family